MHKMGSQPCDWRSLLASSVVCVGVYALIYPLYQPKGKKNTQCIRALRTACEVRLSLIFLGLEFLGISMHMKLAMHLKPNSVKLVMQVSIGERRGS